MVASRFAATTAMALLALADFNTVAGTSSLPSLKLGFKVHRSTMEVYGTSTFDVYVKPVLSGSSVTFDGKVSFEQDGTTYNFVLIDSVPYYEVVSGTSNSTTCVPTENILSVPDIVQALASATAVSSVNTDQDISCTNGTWLSTTFAGEPYVLCTGAKTGSGDFTVYGEDLSVSFEYLSEDVTITKPTNAPSDCEAVTGDSVALSSLGQLYGITTSGSRRVLKEEAGAAHLASSNMFAGALATGKCSIGKNVDWVALSGPMKGSMGSDFIYQFCGDSSSGSDTLLSKFGGLIGQCPGSTTRRSLVYDGGKYCDAACSLRYAAARAMHAKYVTAGICGTTYNGLISKEYAGLLAGGLLIPHHSSKNDGIVEFQSCVGDLDASKFDTTYASTWYAAKLNHADTTFHDGDGLFSSAQKPLKWFECLL
ncbi:hypothetical protein PF002_g26809 [Phytophthora fragariae]|uniref:Uncharacterized protein n=1 Tax=Phytophthora fragariae TaxID=53985 RepID=A0A6A3WDC0_9STRA|nr:hypothetical protein PF002_g26809 [Phytophthora fragariae]